MQLLIWIIRCKANLDLIKVHKHESMNFGKASGVIIIFYKL